MSFIKNLEIRRNWEAIIKSFVCNPTNLDNLVEEPIARPLSDMSINEIICSIARLYKTDNNIILPVDQIPSESRENYDTYSKYLVELVHRDPSYHSTRRIPDVLIGTN